MPTMKQADFDALQSEVGHPAYAGKLPPEVTAILNDPQPTGAHSGDVATADILDELVRRGKLDKLQAEAAATKLLSVLRDATFLDPNAAEPAKLLAACISEGSLTTDDVGAINSLSPPTLGPSIAQGLFGWSVYEENVRDAMGLSIKEEAK